MLRDARLSYSLLLKRKKLGERIFDRLVISLLRIIQVLDGSDGSLAGDAKQAADLLRELDPGLHTCLDHAEKQHGHECEGKRDQPTVPEEIIEVQIVKKAADSIAEFAAAKGSELLLGGEGCVGRGQLKLFHK
jgi:hypothetical protein